MKKIIIITLSFFLIACNVESEDSFDIHLTLRSDVVYNQNKLVVYYADNSEFEMHDLCKADSIESNCWYGFCDYGNGNGYAIATFKNDSSYKEVRFCEIVGGKLQYNFFLIEIINDSVIVETGYNAWPDYEE